MKPFSKDTPRYREIIFLTTSALFMFNTISYHSEPCVCHSEPFVRHSERSEESRCSAQGKLREEFHCFALG